VIRPALAAAALLPMLHACGVSTPPAAVQGRDAACAVPG
jgi:hypothetical protein